MSISVTDFKKGMEMDCSRILFESFKWYLDFKGSDWIRSKFSPQALLLNSENGISLVATDENFRILGYLHADIAAYSVAYLSVIGVATSGKGVGSLLLNALEQRLKSTNIRKIWLLVSHINQNAVVFYIRKGYEFSGVLRDFTLNGLHEIILSKDLKC
jgi:Acetyltransferases